MVNFFFFRWMCDYHKDCEGGEDEQDCRKLKKERIMPLYDLAPHYYAPSVITRAKKESKQWPPRAKMEEFQHRWKKITAKKEVKNACTKV